jgi:hypothetical protein
MMTSKKLEKLVVKLEGTLTEINSNHQNLLRLILHPQLIKKSQLLLNHNNHNKSFPSLLKIKSAKLCKNCKRKKEKSLKKS